MTIFLKSIIRNFKKHINLNLINIVGIALGLTITTLCFLIIQYEFSFNRDFENADNIYRIIRGDRDLNGTVTFSSGTSSMLSPNVGETCPEVLHSARYFNNGVDVHQPKSTDIFNEQIAIVDKEIVDIFSLKFIKGNAQTSLSSPFGVVLSLETANRIFKDKDPIGESLVIQGFYFQNQLFEVLGVIEDMPENSSISFNMITTESSFLPDWLWHSWPDNSSYLPVQTFIQTKDKINLTGLNNTLNGLVKQHFPNEFHSKIDYHLQPLKRIHLYSNADYSFGSGGDISYIYFFITLSVLIMALVVINFLKVSNTLFQSRLIETGVKKVFGWSAPSVVVSFLIETLLLIFVCLPITLLLVYLSIPLVNQSINSNITLSLLTSSSVFIRYLFLLVALSLIIGIIPSYRFSRMRPVLLLSKQLKSKRRMYSQNILLVIQFCVVIILIISTLHIRKQFNYMTQKDLGFTKENVIISTILGSDPELRNRCEDVKEAFMQHPDIIEATTSHGLIGNSAERHNVKPDGHEPMDMMGVGVDADYISFFGLKLISGRDFQKSSSYDENSVILNKRAVEILGWDNAVGKAFEFRGLRGQVIGVVDDFHINGLSQEIRPAYLQLELPKNLLALKYRGNNLSDITQFIHDKQVELSPNSIPQSFFLSDVLLSQYGNEQMTMRIFGIFSILAIILSCIGLLGIVMEVCQSKIKEIGIRKVNGAKISEVMFLINKSFIKNIVIAFAITIPIAWYAMNQWLQNFAYRTELSWWIFALAGFLALGIALLTVSWQSWRAARRNPVEALRYE